ncbi:MAG: hypothetical protein N2651_06535 [Fimbriimonadales bacterium]|nr:hypothetical protein [Fimbriimonadales bacterium]
MIDLILILALVVMGCALGFAWLRWKQTRVITPLGGFLAGSVFFVQLGFLYFYFVYERAWFAQNALLTLSLGILAALLGGWLGLTLLEPRSRIYQVPLRGVRWEYPMRVYGLVALLLMGLTALYFILLGYVPLFMGLETLLTEGFMPRLLQKPRTMRSIYINPDAAYIPMQGLLEAFRFVGLSMVGVWFIHSYRTGKRRALSAAIVALCIFWLISTGQRWPLLHFLLVIMVYFSYTTPPRELRRVLSWVVVVGAIFGVIISALQARTSDIAAYLPAILSFGVVNLAERILYGNAIAPVLSFDVFPKEYPWLYGQSYVQNLLSYLPGPFPSFPVTFNFMVMKETVGFTAPPDFYTEAYVNFGLIGVIVMSFFAGLGLALLDVWLKKYRDSVLGLSAISVLTTYAFLVCTTSITFSLRPLIVTGIVLTVFFLLGAIENALRVGWVHRGRLPTASPSRQAQL